MKLNQQGKVGTVLLTLLFVAAILILIFAYVLSQREDTVVVGSSSKSEVSEATSEPMASTPDNWQEYTNEDNGYVINYPASWGTIKQTEPHQDTFEYRFTSREEVVITQSPDSSDGIEFDGDYSVFNQFEEIRNSVLYCSNSECSKSHSMPIGGVRLFTNKNSRDSSEVFIEKGTLLEMIGVVNTNHDNYPGLNIVVQVDDQVEGKNIVEKRMNANEERYDFFLELRDFLDYVR